MSFTFLRIKIRIITNIIVSDQTLSHFIKKLLCWKNAWAIGLWPFISSYLKYIYTYTLCVYAVFNSWEQYFSVKWIVFCIQILFHFSELQLIELKSEEHRLQKQVDVIKKALFEIGCEELPSGCDLPSLDITDIDITVS